jgi:hypothetical protein
MKIGKFFQIEPLNFNKKQHLHLLTLILFTAKKAIEGCGKSL